MSCLQQESRLLSAMSLYVEFNTLSNSELVHLTSWGGIKRTFELGVFCSLWLPWDESSTAHLSLSALISTAIISLLWSGSTIHGSQLFWLKEPLPITCLGGGWEYLGCSPRYLQAARKSGTKGEWQHCCPLLKTHLPDTWPSLAPLETK